MNEDAFNRHEDELVNDPEHMSDVVLLMTLLLMATDQSTDDAATFKIRAVRGRVHIMSLNGDGVKVEGSGATLYSAAADFRESLAQLSEETEDFDAGEEWKRGRS
jgi:hypothetical protein